MRKKSFRLSIPARVHLSLLCLESGGYRRNGGFGFAIAPGYECVFEAAESIEVLDLRMRGVGDPLQVGFLSDLLVGLKGDGESGLRMTIESGYAPHIGLGSGTALALAAVEGWAIAHDLKLSRDDIRRLSHRGGTSGIGVTTYFDGGFVFEVGSKQDGCPYESSDRTSGHIEAPLVVTAHAMPAWPIGIFQPRNCEAIGQDVEDAIFRNTLPLSRPEVSAILYEGILGIVPALISDDLCTFAAGLCRLQKTAWKSAERVLHRAWLTKTEEILYGAGALCCALSSFGPSLLVLADTLESLARLKEATHDLGELAVVSVQNAGRTKTYA